MDKWFLGDFCGQWGPVFDILEIGFIGPVVPSAAWISIRKRDCLMGKPCGISTWIIRVLDYDPWFIKNKPSTLFSHVEITVYIPRET